MSVVYISGPITGMPELNFPAFAREAARLRAAGFEVENPAENPPPPCGSWQGWMRLAIVQIARSDWLYMLPGWEKSKGAVIEHRLASDIGLRIEYADTSR